MNKGLISKVLTVGSLAMTGILAVAEEISKRETMKKLDKIYETCEQIGKITNV